MPRIGKATSRERVLTDHELASVWRGADSIGLFGSVVRLLVLTGMRREEATQLRWSEVHGDHIELSSNRVKNGESHIVSLSAPARKLLDSIPRIADFDFVFTVSGVRPISGWSRPKVDLDFASGVSDWRIHDLRRSLATELQKLGFNLQVVECVLGHTSGSRGGIVGVYQRHNFAAEKAAALEAWGAHVMSLTNR